MPSQENNLMAAGTLNCYRIPGQFLFSDSLESSSTSEMCSIDPPDVPFPVEDQSLDWVERLPPTIKRRISNFRESHISSLPHLTPENILDYFQLERYTSESSLRKFLKTFYYTNRGYFPRRLKVLLQRLAVRGWDRIDFPTYPVDETVQAICEAALIELLHQQNREEIPLIWFWPNGHRGALCMTHDIEMEHGLNLLPELLKMDLSIGLRSSYGIVPENRYQVSDEVFERIRNNRSEVHTHGLNHDGFLFHDKQTFMKRAVRINQFMKRHQISGFRAPAMHRNFEWLPLLDADFDMSVPNIGHFEPQSGGCCTVMPYFIGHLLELPLTMLQDYTLYYILRHFSLDIWTEQLQIILRRNGLISFNCHPDYMARTNQRAMYRSLLEYLTQFASDQDLWVALPSEIAAWWRNRSNLVLQESAGGWSIIGPGSEHARIAYASVEGKRINYRITLRAEDHHTVESSSFVG